MKRQTRYIFVHSDSVLPGQPPVNINLATKEQLAYQPHFVRLNLLRKFQDDHLWMSVLRRKTDTNFTRLQRFGVCFCLLFMTMIANAIFYGVAEASNSASDTIALGPFSLSISTLITSILGALVVVPVSAVVTIFFLKSKRRNASAYKVDSASRTENDAADLQSTSAGGVLESEPPDTDIVVRKPGSSGEPSYERVGNPASTQLVQQRMVKATRTLDFPHWCQYIGWALVLGSMFGAGIFLVFYAMQWGRQKSQQWLLSFVLSFLQTALLVQPLKVAVLGFALVVIFRKDYDVESAPNVRVRYFNEDLKKVGVAYLHELEAREQRNPVRRAAIASGLNAATGILLLLMQYCVCYSNRDPGTYHLHGSVLNHLGCSNRSCKIRVKILHL